MVTQIARFNCIATVGMITKTLKHSTPSLPSGVESIARFNRIVTAEKILEVVVKPYANPLLTDDGSYLVTDEGDYRAYVD